MWSAFQGVLIRGARPPLRMVRMAQHVFAEITLAAVGACVRVGTLNIAILAAGDIFVRAGRDIVGAAERVVVAAGVDHGRLSPLEAAGQQRRDQQETDTEPRRVTSHASSISPTSSWPGLNRQSIEKMAFA